MQLIYWILKFFPILSTTMLQRVNTMSYRLPHQGEAAYSIAKEISFFLRASSQDRYTQCNVRFKFLVYDECVAKIWTRASRPVHVNLPDLPKWGLHLFRGGGTTWFHDVQWYWDILRYWWYWLLWLRRLSVLWVNSLVSDYYIDPQTNLWIWQHQMPPFHLSVHRTSGEVGQKPPLSVTVQGQQPFTFWTQMVWASEGFLYVRFGECMV